jgi:hypothetical protein
MLTSRRERYDAESGRHPLYFHFGGSAGHSGELHIDIETGVVGENFQGRRWNVSILTPGQSRVAKEEQDRIARDRREEEKRRLAAERTRKAIRDNADAIVRALAGGKKETAGGLRRLGLSHGRVDAALALLMSEDRVQVTTLSRSNGKGSRDVNGYELVVTTAPQQVLKFPGQA